MDRTSDTALVRGAIESVAAEGGPLGMPTERFVSVALRRWRSSSRRGIGQDDFEKRIDDLVDGLIQQFEVEPALVGSLVEDYRYLASAIGHAVERRPRPAVDAIVAAIDRLRDRAHVIVAIDGMSAAGKSTLARRLAERRNLALVNGDDFYRVMDDDRRFQLPPEVAYHQDFDWQRLMSEAIVPLREGRPARFQRYDWSNGTLGEWVTVGPNQVVVVEGVYVSRPELCSLFDLTVWVDTTADVRAKRQAARDDSPEWVDRWDRAERYYVAEFSPSDSADLVVVENSVVV